MLTEAPLHADVADAPQGGRAYWLTARDGVRLRIGAWVPENARGTVLLFPGRTEYVEKYGRAAADLAARGYATLVVDWRGQGLADRLVPDAMSGHVHRFDDYQQDVRAVREAAQALDLPRPWHLLAHSMGGCIGLRALHNGLPVNSASFSAPMWGIHMSQLLRPVAWTISWSSRHLRMDQRYAPGTLPEPYVLYEPFETNRLTCDRDMYQYMIDQTRAFPALGLGGPSLRWLNEALKECRTLSHIPSPDFPCLTFLGTDEDIVDPSRVHARMSAWPGGALEIIEGARHEVLMETPSTRRRIFDRMTGFMDAHADQDTGTNGHPPAARAAQS